MERLLPFRLLVAVASSVFSTIFLLIFLSLPVVSLFGPAYVVNCLLSNISTTLANLGILVTIILQSLPCIHLYKTVLKPLFAQSRPGSRYVTLWISAVALTHLRILLSLLLSGPLRILFLGQNDIFDILSRIRSQIRNIDARILRVRPPTYSVKDHGRPISIPLRDGILTSATLYSPLLKDGRRCDESPRPVILIRTPYNRDALSTWGIRFAERGYHLVAQDTRGRFGSTGEFFPMLNEATDGAATVEWIAKQPWCNGSVGMTGVSYLGLASWAAMREEIPALRAVAPILAATDLYNVMFGRESGAAHVELMFRWSHLVIHLMNKPFGMLEAIFTFFTGTGRALRDAYKHAPLNEADTKYLCPDSEPLEWFRDGFAHPLGTEPFWKDKRKFVDFTHMTKVPPVLVFAGWYDFFCGEQLHDFVALRKLSDECRLVVGPYTHWHVVAMQPKMFRVLIDFFDRHLLHEPAARDVPPVEVFSMGTDMGWMPLKSWPPPNTVTKRFLLLHGDNEENILVEDSDSKNSRETEISYIYDPAHPTPQIGGATFDPSNCGRLPQNSIEERDDVVVFTSAPLVTSFLIAGEIKVRLDVESSVEGTDYVARACHVLSDNTSFNVADGIVRRFDLVPGKRIKIEITLSPVMNRLAVGDRLRIHVCSSAFPKYGRHLNTRESFHLELEGNALLSEQILFLGGEKEGGGGCDVLVPVLP